MNEQINYRWIRRSWRNPENQRYYVAMINKDLLGDWFLTRIWGGKQKRGSQKEVLCSSYEEALVDLRRIEKIRLRHGYEEVFG